MSPTRRSFVKLMLAAPVASAFTFPERPATATSDRDAADWEYRALTMDFGDLQWEEQIAIGAAFYCQLSDGKTLDQAARNIAESPATAEVWQWALSDMIRRAQLILDRLELIDG